MQLTDYHAKYFAHELTRRYPSDSVEKFAGAVASAQVDLNPHQVDAALFAFRSPLSKGAVLADEVGLGKTIEAGLVISQRWAERKRRILIITPANLRKQWHQELTEKFFLPCTLIESRSYNAAIKLGNFRLGTISKRLKDRLRKHEPVESLEEELDQDYEALDETAEEWPEEPAEEPLSDADRAALEAEIADLDAFAGLATSIEHNAKGRALLKALGVAFAQTAALGGAQKAIIFTESRRTQNYLLRVLADSPFSEGIETQSELRRGRQRVRGSTRFHL